MRYETEYEDEKVHRGRPTIWDRSLGPGVNFGHRAPVLVHELLKKPNVKKILNRMTIDPAFEIEVTALLDKYSDPKP